MDKSYLAGYIDGEGCLSVSKRKDVSYRVGYDIFAVVSISSTSRIVLDEIEETYGGSLYRTQRSNKHKPLFILTLAGRPCVNLLGDVLPFLKLKVEQASLILELQSTRQRGHNQTTAIDFCRRDQIYFRIRELNKRGSRGKQEEGYKELPRLKPWHDPWYLRGATQSLG